MWLVVLGAGAAVAILLWKAADKITAAPPPKVTTTDKIRAAVSGDLPALAVATLNSAAATVADVKAAVAQVDMSNPPAVMAVSHLAQAAGLAETSKALAAHATEVSEVKRAIEIVKEAPLQSPIMGVTDAQWSKFAALYKGNNPAEISPSYCLGLYNIGFLRLRELGLAHEVKQGTHEGKTVWMGQFREPITLRKFLANPKLQYQVFVRDMSNRAEYIRENYGDLIGEDIEGEPATLSGLLGVIKLAGTKGFEGWTGDPEQRQKFANTTTAYHTANNLF